MFMSKGRNIEKTLSERDKKIISETSDKALAKFFALLPEVDKVDRKCGDEIKFTLPVVKKTSFSNTINNNYDYITNLRCLYEFLRITIKSNILTHDSWNQLSYTQRMKFVSNALGFKLTKIRQVKQELSRYYAYLYFLGPMACKFDQQSELFHHHGNIWHLNWTTCEYQELERKGEEITFQKNITDNKEQPGPCTALFKYSYVPPVTKETFKLAQALYEFLLEIKNISAIPERATIQQQFDILEVRIKRYIFRTRLPALIKKVDQLTQDLELNDEYCPTILPRYNSIKRKEWALKGMVDFDYHDINVKKISYGLNKINCVILSIYTRKLDEKMEDKKKELSTLISPNQSKGFFDNYFQIRSGIKKMEGLKTEIDKKDHWTYFDLDWVLLQEDIIIFQSVAHYAKNHIAEFKQNLLDLLKQNQVFLKKEQERITNKLHEEWVCRYNTWSYDFEVFVKEVDRLLVEKNLENLKSKFKEMSAYFQHILIFKSSTPLSYDQLPPSICTEIENMLQPTYENFNQKYRLFVSRYEKKLTEIQTNILTLEVGDTEQSQKQIEALTWCINVYNNYLANIKRTEDKFTQAKMTAFTPNNNIIKLIAAKNTLEKKLHVREAPIKLGSIDDKMEPSREVNALKQISDYCLELNDALVKDQVTLKKISRNIILLEELVLKFQNKKFKEIFKLITNDEAYKAILLDKYSEILTIVVNNVHKKGWGFFKNLHGLWSKKDADHFVCCQIIASLLTQSKGHLTMTAKSSMANKYHQCQLDKAEWMQTTTQLGLAIEEQVKMSDETIEAANQEKENAKKKYYALLETENKKLGQALGNEEDFFLQAHSYGPHVEHLRRMKQNLEKRQMIMRSHKLIQCIKSIAALERKTNQITIPTPEFKSSDFAANIEYRAGQVESQEVLFKNLKRELKEVKKNALKLQADYRPLIEDLSSERNTNWKDLDKLMNRISLLEKLLANKKEQLNSYIDINNNLRYLYDVQLELNHIETQIKSRDYVFEIEKYKEGLRPSNYIYKEHQFFLNKANRLQAIEYELMELDQSNDILFYLINEQRHLARVVALLDEKRKEWMGHASTDAVLNGNEYLKGRALLECGFTEKEVKEYLNGSDFSNIFLAQVRFDMGLLNHREPKPKDRVLENIIFDHATLTDCSFPRLSKVSFKNADIRRCQFVSFAGIILDEQTKLDWKKHSIHILADNLLDFTAGGETDYLSTMIDLVHNKYDKAVTSQLVLALLSRLNCCLTQAPQDMLLKRQRAFFIVDKLIEKLNLSQLARLSVLVSNKEPYKGLYHYLDHERLYIITRIQKKIIELVASNTDRVELGLDQQNKINAIMNFKQANCLTRLFNPAPKYAIKIALYEKEIKSAAQETIKKLQLKADLFDARIQNDPNARGIYTFLKKNSWYYCDQLVVDTIILLNSKKMQRNDILKIQQILVQSETLHLGAERCCWKRNVFTLPRRTGHGRDVETIPTSRSGHLIYNICENMAALSETPSNSDIETRTMHLMQELRSHHPRVPQLEGFPKKSSSISL